MADSTKYNLNSVFKSISYIVVGVGVVFLLVGIVFLCYGIKFEESFSGLDYRDQDALNPLPKLTGYNITYMDARKYSSIGGYAALGSVLVFFSIPIIVGVHKQSSFATLFAAIFYLVLFSEELIMGTTLRSIFKARYVERIRNGSAVIELMSDYKWNSSLPVNGTLIERAPVELLQSSLGCCGSKSYKDWNSLRPKDVSSSQFPSSCCGSFNYTGFLENVTSPPCLINSTEFYKTGCTVVLGQSIDTFLWTGIAILFLAVAHLVVAGLAAFLYKGIRDSRARHITSLHVESAKNRRKYSGVLNDAAEFS